MSDSWERNAKFVHGELKRLSKTQEEIARGLSGDQELKGFP